MVRKGLMADRLVMRDVMNIADDVVKGSGVVVDNTACMVGECVDDDTLPSKPDTTMF